METEFPSHPSMAGRVTPARSSGREACSVCALWLEGRSARCGAVDFGPLLSPSCAHAVEMGRRTARLRQDRLPGKRVGKARTVEQTAGRERLVKDTQPNSASAPRNPTPHRSAAPKSGAVLALAPSWQICSLGGGAPWSQLLAVIRAGEEGAHSWQS